MFFVMLAEVLIYVPSIAQFRYAWLHQRTNAAEIALTALEVAPATTVDPALGHELLADIGVEAVILQHGGAGKLILGSDRGLKIAAAYTLVNRQPWPLVRDAFATLLLPDDRLIAVTGLPDRGSGNYVQIILHPAALKHAMVAYSQEILLFSIAISLFTAGLVYISLDALMVRPIRRITRSVIAFRNAPEAAASRLDPSPRRDEIGIVERELAAMQRELQTSLNRKTRLATLGTAVSKINHDLRNILTSAQLLSERLAEAEDPTVKTLAPRVTHAIDRAIKLCASTLAYGQAGEPHPERFPLRGLAAEVGASLGLDRPGAVIAWDNRVPDDFTLTADPDQIFRVLLNLARNAYQAITTAENEGGADGHTISISAHFAHGTAVIDVADDGPGLPDHSRAHLFKPFRASGSSGGTGLGLIIAKDLVEAHDGTLDLVTTGSNGTRFRVTLPMITPGSR